MTEESKVEISPDTRYTAVWNEINCRMQMRDRAVWNYVAGAAVLLGVGFANAAENAWLSLFVPWLGFVSVVLFAFHDGYIASEVQFLATLSSADERTEIPDWFQSSFSRSVFKRQHWLLCGQFVAMCVPCVVALILAGWHLKLPIDDYVTMIYWLAYLGDWIVVLITLAISFVTWQSHSSKIRDIY